jgi:hypothetical protein
MFTAKSTKKNKGRKSNATKLAYKKFRFIEQVITDSRLSLLATRAAIFVGSKCSLDNGGTAIIGQDKIAERLDAWRQDVSRALRQAAAFGHIEIIRRGRDHANAYRMVLKDEASASKTAADDVGKSSTSRPNMMSGNSDFDVGDSPTDSPFFSPGAPTEPPGRERAERNGEKKRETSAYADEAQAAGAPPLTRDPAEEAAAEENKESSFTTAAPSPGPESSTERSPSVEREERFRELRAIWARPWTDDVDADRRAFARACQEAAPDDIIAAATAFVAAADAPRFLPPLAKWLANRGWEKPPPTKTKRGANGAHRPGRKPNLADIGLELARRYAAERAAS